MGSLGRRFGFGVAVAVTGVVLGFVVGGVPGTGPEAVRIESQGDDLRAVGSGASAVTTTVLPATTTTLRPAAEVRVRVYNGSEVSGAATPVGNELRDAGYTVLDPGPSRPERLATSEVLFGVGFEGEAHAVAAVLDLPPGAVRSLDDPAAYDGAAEANVLVIVGNDLARRA